MNASDFRSSMHSRDTECHMSKTLDALCVRHACAAVAAVIGHVKNLTD